MFQIYTVYFNGEYEVIPIRMCKGYTHSCDIFEETTKEFVKKYNSDSECTKAIKICKYEEGVNSGALLASSLYRNDTSFLQGYIFVKKGHEACVYEKTVILGTFYNSYLVKYLGRIGVLAQEIPFPDEMVRLQDLVEKMRGEITGLEQKLADYSFHTKEREESQQSFTSTRPPTEYQIKKNNMAPIFDELKNAVAAGHSFLKKRKHSRHQAEQELDRLINDIESFCVKN